ncbi:NAD(P)/FAD-dependent oxidoreductase [soil metagenome]
MGNVTGDEYQHLARAVRHADLRILLMCLVHLTADTAWLDEPFRPRRDVRLVAPPDAGLAPDVADRIRAVALELLADGPPPPVIGDPGAELMQHMMSVCLGEEVPAEYAGMMREDMGFVSRDADLRPVSVDGHDDADGAHDAAPDVLVIGAGVSGIALGAQLGRLGVPYTVVDKNADVGGTWYENRYPGCGVDTPNHAYSFSFGTRNRWTRYFSPREQIQDYLERCADEFGVRPNVRFETELVATCWDTAQRRWCSTLRRSDGTEYVHHSAVLVSALGLLNVPRVPGLDGTDTFEGPLFHSARWPDQLELEGRRVAVVGTGATSMQIVPSIAGRVASVTVFQRSAQWARPIDGYRNDIGPGQQWLLDHVPYYLEWFRFVMLWRYGDGLLPLLRKDPEWPHPERAVNRVNDRHRQEMADFLVESLGDRTDLVDQCMPTYPPYGKRILIDNGWFATLTEPNIHLVTDHIERITPSGIVTTDGAEHPADVIVMATGFHTTRPLARIDVRGRDGRPLADVWGDDDATAHLGITVPGFPNLFLMGGPNTGLGHGGSAIFQSECQARYISAFVSRMAHERFASVEVRQDVHDRYVQRVDHEHEQLIWTHPGMTNWYRNRHGRIVALMPWRLVDYWEMTHDPDLDEYLVERVGADAATTGR